MLSEEKPLLVDTSINPNEEARAGYNNRAVKFANIKWLLVFLACGFLIGIIFYIFELLYNIHHVYKIVCVSQKYVNYGIKIISGTILMLSFASFFVYSFFKEEHEFKAVIGNAIHM